jgi:arginase
MAVAMLTGHCWRNMTQSVPGFRPVPEPNVLMLGARDVDPREGELLGATAIVRLSAATIKTDLGATLYRLAERASEVYLHLDLDVIDPSEGNANHYAVPGGLTSDALLDAVLRIKRRIPIAAMAITAYDPDADVGGRVAAIAQRVALAVVSPD